MLDRSQIVKMANSEPKSFVLGYILDSQPKTVGEICRECADIIGIDTIEVLRSLHPGLSPQSVRGYLDHSLSSVVDGDMGSGFFLTDKPTRKIGRFALNFAAISGVSSYAILRGDPVADTSAAILEKLLDNNGNPITVFPRDVEAVSSAQLHRDLDLPYGTIARHLFRFKSTGLVELSTFEEMKFSYGGVSDWESALAAAAQQSPQSEVEYFTIKATKAMRYLFQQQYRELTARSINNACRYNHNSPEAEKNRVYEMKKVLSMLANLGLVKSNDRANVFGGQIKVKLTAFGVGVGQYLGKLKDYQELPLGDNFALAVSALNTYNIFRNRKAKPEEHYANIRAAVTLLPGPTLSEIEIVTGRIENRYVLDMLRNGTLERTGKGNLSAPFRYTLA